ncbi:hypothetical protein ZWY2020_013524 [Hordeum vulgare]|nr:hypothetical protein ZWY2020_013524 [Hordeum vulgare]
MCLKRSDTKEKKAERFDKCMVAREKKIKLQEKKVEPTSTSEDAKMLTMKMSDLDPDATKIV